MPQNQRVICPRYVTPSLFKKVNEISLISLEEFQSRWKVSRKQLAKVCHCSLATVDRWFVRSECSTHQVPKLHHLLWLTIADKVWRSELKNRY